VRTSAKPFASEADDRHGFRQGTTRRLISKGDLAVVGRGYSAVGNGDTVNVAGVIIEDGTRALDGRFAVNDPVLLP